MRGASAQTVADVVAGYDEVAAVVALAPDDDMNVRVVRIPVIDFDPIELGAEIRSACAITSWENALGAVRHAL